MAKTKRRQLAALAAQAELKELNGDKERISSCDKSGPSGVPLLDDPMVEIRTQRVIFKIPALPAMAVTDSTRAPAIAKKETLRKHRRKKPRMDIDFSSEQIPADEAKIGKGIFQLGKWKRKKRITDLTPSVAKVTASTGLSNGNQPSLVAKSITEKHPSGELQLSLPKVPGPGRQSKPRVNLLTGPRKRVKLQEVLVRSPTERENNISGTHCSPKEDKGCRMHRAGDQVVISDHSSIDLLIDASRSQDSRKACNGDVVSTIAHSQPSKQKRRGNTRKFSRRAPADPKAAVLSHSRPTTRAQISKSEAIAIEGFQKIQHQKNASQQRENYSKAPNEDALLVGAADREAANATQDQSQAEHQNATILREQLDHVRPTVNSSSHIQTSRHTSFQLSWQDVSQKDLAQQLQNEPFAPSEQEAFQVVAQPGTHQSACSFGEKSNMLRGAELIKQESQLALMRKRLEAAGGLRNWLIDKELGQFVPILEKWNIDNLTLLQLTMEGLKSMGLLPVGPRRKLIHAVSSLTLPSLYKGSFRDSRPRY